MVIVCVVLANCVLFPALDQRASCRGASVRCRWTSGVGEQVPKGLMDGEVKAVMEDGSILCMYCTYIIDILKDRPIQVFIHDPAP